MLGADIVRFISEAVLAVLLLVSSPPLWALMVLAGVLGAGLAFFSPAMTGLMPEIVSAARLQQANALRGIATSTGQIVGPSLAGIIVAAGGAGRAIAIDSATFAVSAACLLRMQIPARPDHGRHFGCSQPESSRPNTAHTPSSILVTRPHEPSTTSQVTRSRESPEGWKAA
jgi:MFS family permease